MSVLWSIIWLIWTTNEWLLWYVHSILSSVIYFWCIWTMYFPVYLLTLALCHLWWLYYILPVLIVKSKLWPDLSSLLKFDAVTNWIKLAQLLSFLTKLIFNDFHEYHKEHCQPNAFSSVHIELLLANLLYSIARYMSNQGLTHCNWFRNCMIANQIALLSKNWFWSGCIMYNSYCPHKYMMGWILEYPSS